MGKQKHCLFIYWNNTNLIKFMFTKRLLASGLFFIQKDHEKHRTKLLKNYEFMRIGTNVMLRIRVWIYSITTFVNANSRQERKNYMKNTTTELQWRDVILKPGQCVRTTNDSDYAGLEGVILEIHTGEDKETDNLTPDIHCCFDYPESEIQVQKLEERFSSLYNMPKKLEELGLDEIIMSPDELAIIPKKSVYLLHYIGTDEWARPVYQDQYGKLWRDVELGDYEIPHLYSAVENEFDGEPDTPIPKPFKILTAKPKNPYEFQYMMLGRLQSDCEYYLNYGNRCIGRLYHLDEKKQIAAMKKLWNELPDEGKPEWLTWEQILEYEKEMYALQNKNTIKIFFKGE